MAVIVCRFHKQTALNVRSRLHYSSRGVGSISQRRAAAGQKRTVCYTTDAQIKNGNKFATQGLQIVAGVPLHCDEPADFKTFRVGLFGLDKLGNIGFGQKWNRKPT